MLGKKGYHIFFLDDIMKIITDMAQSNVKNWHNVYENSKKGRNTYVGDKI